MYLEEIYQTKFIRLNVQGKNEIKIILHFGVKKAKVHLINKISYLAFKRANFKTLPFT